MTVTEHISTEEVERIARAMEDCCPCGCGNELMVNFAAPALRSLAAERDELEAQMIRELLSAEKKRLTENERLREALRAISEGRWNRGRGADLSAREFARDALGEENR